MYVCMYMCAFAVDCANVQTLQHLQTHRQFAALMQKNLMKTHQPQRHFNGVRGVRKRVSEINDFGVALGLPSCVLGRPFTCPAQRLTFATINQLQSQSRRTLSAAFCNINSARLPSTHIIRSLLTGHMFVDMPM